jgi:DNA ligase-1
MNALPQNPAGWLVSEKLDGCRCILTDGGTLLSRHGKRFNPPSWFMEGMPKGVRLDGELWNYRGGFDELVSAIQRRANPWDGVRFMVFDIAVLRVPIESRLAALGRLQLPPHVGLVPHRPCLSQADLDATEAAIVAGGGEGLCLRAPQSFYRPGNFLKVKRLFPDLNRSILD